jgi:uncharacterized phiE125 gp8 family phage protein
VNWSLKTAATDRVADLATLKRQCRIADGVDDEDALLDVYAGAAERWVESYTGRALRTQTWQASVEAFPRRLWLPRAAPLQAVSFVKYYDTSNVLQTLSASVYTVPAFGEPAWLELAYGQVWPSVYDRADAVRVEYDCGWADAAAVPPSLVQAVLLLVGHYYENRENSISGTITGSIEMAAEALCAPHRVWWRQPEWTR